MRNNPLYKKALNYSLRLLLVRNYSKVEIERKLKFKGYDVDISQKVIAQLIEWDYLNDKRYAESYIAFHKHKGKGKNALLYSLAKKGIQGQYAKEALEGLYNEDEELEQLNKLATKKLKVLLNRQPEHAIKYKLYNYLNTKGFTKSAVLTWIDTNLQAILDNNSNKL